MGRQLIILVVLSIIAVISVQYTAVIVHSLLQLHKQLISFFGHVFSGASVGDLLRRLCALLVIPFAVGYIPALVYWAIKRSKMPYTFAIIWVTWIVLVTALSI